MFLALIKSKLQRWLTKYARKQDLTTGGDRLCIWRNTSNMGGRAHATRNPSMIMLVVPRRREKSWQSRPDYIGHTRMRREAAEK